MFLSGPYPPSLIASYFFQVTFTGGKDHTWRLTEYLRKVLVPATKLLLERACKPKLGGEGGAGSLSSWEPDMGLEPRTVGQ